MSSQRYSPEFKDEAARQIIDRGYSVVEVSVGADLRDCLSSAYLPGMGAAAVMVPVGVGCATCVDLEYSSIYGGQLEVRLSLKLH